MVGFYALETSDRGYASESQDSDKHRDGYSFVPSGGGIASACSAGNRSLSPSHREHTDSTAGMSALQWICLYARIRHEWKIQERRGSSAPKIAPPDGLHIAASKV